MGKAEAAADCSVCCAGEPTEGAGRDKGGTHGTHAPTYAINVPHAPGVALKFAGVRRGPAPRRGRAAAMSTLTFVYYLWHHGGRSRLAGGRLDHAAVSQQASGPAANRMQTRPTLGGGVMLSRVPHWT